MQDVKNFVQDKFYSKGNPLLKFREILTTLILWFLLIAPIFVLFNSLATGNIWDDVYFWTYEDGFKLAQFIETSIIVGFILVLLISIILLVRNNHYVTKVLTKQKTYDVEGLDKRKACLEKIYEDRFGSQAFRESVRYYIVEPEQNFENHFVRDTFKKEGCDF